LLEVRVIRQIEGLAAKLQMNSFRQVKNPHNREVERYQSRCSQSIAADVAESARRGQREAGRVEPGVDTFRSGIDVAIPHHIGAVRVLARETDIAAFIDGERTASLELEYSRNLPAADNPVAETLAREAETKIPYRAEYQTMTDVEARNPRWPANLFRLFWTPPDASEPDAVPAPSSIDLP
jgi:hypothetical protein